MNSLADNTYGIEDENAFTDEELAEIEALSEEEIDLAFDDDFDFDDIDIDDNWTDDISPVQEATQTVAQPIEADLAQEPEGDVFDELPPMPNEAENIENNNGDKFDDSFEEELDESVFNELPDPSDLPPISEVPPSIPEVVYEEDTLEGDHIPVPRVNISVFCETENVSNLVELAAKDRRLSKAHIEILMGGIKRAISHFQQEDTPNLIIIENASTPEELLTTLDQLASLCDPSTKVIIVGEINDIHLYRELMDRGISDYLISPRAPIHITRGISRLYADPSAPPIGRTYVFIGARGGVGSSTICHNVGWAMAEQYRSDTTILDLDLAFGTASLDFEQEPSQGLAEALTSPERLDAVLLERLLQKCTDRLSLFSAPNMLDRDYDIPASSFEEVLDLTRKGVPNIVVDLPHCWTDWSRKMLQIADEIIITATPDLASFRNAKNIVETLKTLRVNDSSPDLVINQVGVPKRPEIPVEQFTEALGVTPAAIIPWEPQLFGLASTNAESVFETSEKSKTAQSLSGFTQSLLGQSKSKPTSKGISIKSLFRKS